MSIAHDIAIKRALSSADLTPYEGCAVVKNSSGKLALATAGAATIAGVIHVPGKEDDMTDYFLSAFPGIVRVKLADAPGSITDGTGLSLTTDGKFKAAGENDVVHAIAAETGTAGALCEATLCRAITVTVAQS